MNKAKRRLNRLKKEQGGRTETRRMSSPTIENLGLIPKWCSFEELLEERKEGYAPKDRAMKERALAEHKKETTETNIMARGYDLAGQTIHYELKSEPGTDGGMITCSGSTRTTFLQGDDWAAINQEVDAIWKQVRWKKIGAAKAQKLQDELLSNYFEV